MEITTKPARDPNRRRVLLRVAFVLVVLVAAALIAPAAVGLQRHVVADGAMDGTYATGSVVFDEVVPVEQLRIGDVISFFAPQGAGEQLLVTRRIVEIRGDQLVTRGDALTEDDPWLLRVDRGGVARVAFVVPWLGYLWLFVDAIGPLGWLLAVLLAFAVLAVVRFRRRLPWLVGRTNSAVDVPTPPSSPGEPAALG